MLYHVNSVVTGFWANNPVIACDIFTRVYSGILISQANFRKFEYFYSEKRLNVSESHLSI